MEILRAYTPAQASALLLAHPGALPLSGGTDLFVLKKQSPERLHTLVDLSGIDALGTLEIRPGEVLLGAALTADRLERMDLPPALECLRQAAGLLGGPQIRRRATLGGNVQTASPAGDMSTALLCLGARAVLSGATGEREVPLEEFFTGVKKTVRRPEEIILRFRVPLPPEGRSVFLKMGQRNSLAISTVSLAALRTPAGYALALGSVAPTPRRAVKTAAYLSAPHPGLTRAAQLLDGEISPVDDVRASALYRRICAGALLEQAIEELEDGKS